MTIFTKVLSVGLSVCGGGLAWYSLNNFSLEKLNVQNSWHINSSPSVRWDNNWDKRDPTSLVQPSKSKDDETRYNAELENMKPTAKRHIFLIRHGQYNTEGKTDSDRILTALGRDQAVLTGMRLKDFGHKYTHLVVSTLTRAKETADLIKDSLSKTVDIKYCSLLEEGAPIQPEPPIGHWKPEPYQFFEDGARIEAAFRKHIHRADAKQKSDSYEVIVCHANVIRYFICRALQVPGEAWLRMSLHHCSITQMTVMPSGRVILRTVSDSGHLPVNMVTTR